MLEEQAAAIGELRADVVALAAEVRELRRRLGRNSGNSSMAPSADDLPGRKPPEPKPKRSGGRKPGGQPGSPGSHLAWSDQPDDTVPHFPEGSCACGADLAAAADLGVAASHQQVGIPLAAAQVIQHDLHEVACSGCGRVHRGGRPGRDRRRGDGHLRPVMPTSALQALVRKRSTVRFRNGAPQSSRSDGSSDQSEMASRSPDRELTVVLGVESWHSAARTDSRWHAGPARRRLLLNGRGRACRGHRLRPAPRVNPVIPNAQRNVRPAVSSCSLCRGCREHSDLRSPRRPGSVVAFRRGERRWARARLAGRRAVRARGRPGSAPVPASCPAPAGMVTGRGAPRAGLWRAARAGLGHRPARIVAGREGPAARSPGQPARRACGRR